MLASSAAAEDELARPTLKLKISLPAEYNSNFASSRTDLVDGLHGIPAAQLILQGPLSKDLTYTVLAGIVLDRYDKTGFASDVALASFGLTYVVHGWTLRSSYSPKWAFEPFFDTLLVRFDDFVVAAEAPGLSLGAAGTLTPTFGYRERHATDGVSSHHSPFALLNWSKTLGGPLTGWIAEADLELRYLEFDQRPVIARDWFFSQEVSLHRDLFRGVTLRFAAGHENRESNILDRKYETWTVGASITLIADIF